MRERVVVLDYSSANVWVFNLPEEHMQHDEVEEWLSKQGFSIGNINWMAGTLEINNYEPENNIVL